MILTYNGGMATDSGVSKQLKFMSIKQLLQAYPGSWCK
jgi:hypothetical protein